MKKCPRCGRIRMDDKDIMNSLSRHRDGVYICNECGTTEAFFDCFGYEDLEWECDKEEA